MGIAPGYRSDLFVTPAEVYERIRVRVTSWQGTQFGTRSKGGLWRARHHASKTSPGDQVLVLVGERGGGKTWLLRHLAEDESLVASTAVYVDLEERHKFPKIERYIESIEEQVQKSCDGSRTILLLDNVPPLLDDDLRAVERAILWPHITEQGSLMLMALSHPVRICWRMPALRGAERCLLSPFSEGQTRAQLQYLVKKKVAKKGHKAADIHQSSGGLPLLSYLLVTLGKEKSWQAFLDFWLEGIPIDDRDRVQSYLETTCTLKVLEHAGIKRAIEVYRQYQPAGNHSTHPSTVRNLLRKHWVARPMPESPGRIVLVDSIQRATAEILRARSAELYDALKAIS